MKSMTGGVEVSPPHVSRWEERDARRKANSELARQAAENRAARGRSVSLTEQVAKAATRLEGTTVAAALSIIEQTSPTDRDYFLLAEKYGQARKGVLRQLNAPRGSVERAYLEEVGGVGVGDPEDAPDEGAEE